MKQKFLFLTLLLLGVSLLYSCKDDDDDNASKTEFKATLNGANEKPDPTPSTATGAATLIFDKKTKIFTMTVTHTGLTVTSGHIHKGAADVAGGVVFPLTTLTSPISYTSVALTAEQEAELYAGLYYVNLHSTAYPAGEIRGQLIKK